MFSLARKDGKAEDSPSHLKNKIQQKLKNEIWFWENESG